MPKEINLRGLKYSPQTGLIYRNVRVNRGTIGPIVGRDKGYKVIKLDGVTHRQHRLAFLFMKKPVPEQVDHINRDRSDNRWSNLRAATPAQNRANRKSVEGSSSKWLGVLWNKDRKNWRASIKINGKRTDLGSFKCEDEAAMAYNEAALEHFKEFASLNESKEN